MIWKQEMRQSYVLNFLFVQTHSNAFNFGWGRNFNFFGNLIFKFRILTCGGRSSDDKSLCWIWNLDGDNRWERGPVLVFCVFFYNKSELKTFELDTLNPNCEFTDGLHFWFSFLSSLLKIPAKFQPMRFPLLIGWILQTFQDTN